MKKTEKNKKNKSWIFWLVLFIIFLPFLNTENLGKALGGMLVVGILGLISYFKNKKS
ncbi:MAG: hypothetical protein WC137_01080 [Alphaproteobacteria bacterium]